MTNDNDGKEISMTCHLPYFTIMEVGAETNEQADRFPV